MVTITLKDDMDKTILFSALSMYRERMLKDAVTYRNQGNEDACVDCRTYLKRASDLQTDIVLSK